ncbi:MAG: hypothetical protein ACI3VZ_07310 [Faecousia sp.]
MIVLYSYGSKVKTVKALGVRTCTNCGYRGEQRLVKDKFSIKLFYILPIFSMTTKKAVFCAKCGTPRALTSREFKQIKRGTDTV